MVKSYHVMDYIKTGISESTQNCEDVIESIVEETSSNELVVEFTDYSTTNHDKSKFKITVELIE